MVGLFLSWQPRPLPDSPDTIPIILVEVPAVIPERPVEVETPEPVVDADPILDPENTTDSSVPPPDGQRAQPEPAPQSEIEEDEQQTEARDEEASAPTLSVSIAPSRETTLTNPAAEAATATDINPDFVYKFDPFAETAPTPFARVVRAANCSRTNRETRMAFCPNYDENDIYLATIDAGPQSSWRAAEYDPIGDIAVAQSSIGRFTARQDKPQFRGSSELHRVNFDNPDVPDEGCQAVPFGFNGPAAGTLDSNVALPDSKAVHCGQW